MATHTEEQARRRPDYAFNSVTLRFKDATVERRFNVDHLIQGLQLLRVSLLGAAITYASFGILDVAIIPEARAIAAWIRYAVVCPCLLGVLALTYAKIFPRIAQVALAAVMLVSGLGIVVISACSNDPGRSIYYAGLILVIIIGSSVVPIRWIAVATVSSIIFATYQFVAIRINPIATIMLLNNDFFLTASIAAGICASYLQELKLRRIFIRDEGLRLASKESDELRVKAEAASKAKSEFLAVVSHELRTPLNAILGFTEMMNMRLFGPIGSERYASYINDIHQSAKHLLSVVTDILDLSKAEVGKLTIEESKCDVAAISDECLRLLREWAGEHGIRLSLRVACTATPIVLGDLRLIKQALLNLLSNGIKFTPSGGAVGVSIEPEADGRLLVRIADTGIGIAESDLASVLEPFVQVESAFSRKHGGTGLGLPLVKKIMELHGGGVELASKVGAGTVATLWFPAGRVSYSSEEKAPVEGARACAR